MKITDYRVLLLVLVAACSAPAADPVGPDASAPPTPIDPAGRFAVRSSFALAAPPAEVASLLAELNAVTDAPDDPSKYLVDLVVAELPDGTAHTIGVALAPYIASYVNARLDAVAPEFLDGIRALATGANRIATRFETIEDVSVTAGRARRTIEGLRFDDVDIAFAGIGFADASAEMEVSVELDADAKAASDGDRLIVRSHGVEIPFAAAFRAGFDRAVVPSVVPGASDLARALRELVNCGRLGAVIAEALGVGPASLYAQACSIGLGVAAGRIYEQFPMRDAPTSALEVAGTGRAIDRDGDGAMDAISDGVWSGRFDDAALGRATFVGTIQ